MHSEREKGVIDGLKMSSLEIKLSIKAHAKEVKIVNALAIIDNQIQNIIKILTSG